MQQKTYHSLNLNKNKHTKGGVKKHKVKVFQNKNRNAFNKDLTQELISKYDAIDPNAINTFYDLPLSQETLKGLREHKYKIPTQIQKESIGLALQGKDILGAAQTGSGKTLAFLIPVLEKLYCEKWNRIYGLGALIITPTRELAKQIFETLLQVGKYHDFSGGLIIGGKDRKFEVKRMDQCNIVISTPGRLLDHMDKNPLFDCSNMQILVLDEADRCLDMGFEQQMNQIIEYLPPKRQTLLFSATQTKSVKDLARLSLKDPCYVSVHEHLEHSTPKALNQSYMICELKDKVSIIWNFIKRHSKQKIIIFYTSCKQVKYMFEIFSKLRPGTSLMALYGTLHQLRRMDIYDSFCRKSSGVLFATDLAARGLDFPNVHWVVQADCPEDANAYIHRVGRTARYHKGGEAVLLLLPSELHLLENLKEKKVPIDQVEVNPTMLSNPVKKMEAFLSNNRELVESAKRAFMSYIKSVVLMKDKKIFNIEALDLVSFAHSLGLDKPPRIRFLQRRNLKTAGENKDNDNNNNNNQMEIENINDEDNVNVDREKQSFSEEEESCEDEESDEETLTPNKELMNAFESYDIEGDFWDFQEINHEIEVEQIEVPISKNSKPVTKAAMVKKMLKINPMPNKKIVFDDSEGEDDGNDEKKPQIKMEYDEYESKFNFNEYEQKLQIKSEYDEYERKPEIKFEYDKYGNKKFCFVLEHGISMWMAKEALKEKENIDKQLSREKVKMKHKEKKRKLKAAKKQEEQEKDEFSDEEEDGEEPDLSWLPDPDEIYKEDSGETQEQEHVDGDKEVDEVMDREEIEKFKKRKIEDDVSPKKKKRKKNIIDKVISEDLPVNEAEELALLLLNK